MLVKTVIAVLTAAFAGTAAAQLASPVMDNPAGAVYQATLPTKPFFSEADIDGNVKSSIRASAGVGGIGVKFAVKFENLPSEGGPFTYHIHVNPAPHGNCTETLEHLDPYVRGSLKPCNASAPASCQVGDLSGKHGVVKKDPFYDHYVDYYASVKEGIGAFFGNRSFVLHYANGTRLTCANFEKIPAPHRTANSSTAWATAAGSIVTGVPSSTGTVWTPSAGPPHPHPHRPTKPPFVSAAATYQFTISLLAGSLIAATFIV